MEGSVSFDSHSPDLLFLTIIPFGVNLFVVDLCISFLYLTKLFGSVSKSENVEILKCFSDENQSFGDDGKFLELFKIQNFFLYVKYREVLSVLLRRMFFFQKSGLSL